MIVTVKKAEKMFCPMGAGSQDVVMCCGSRCMAWRHLDPEHGFCGMCPALPVGAEEMLRFLEGMNND